MKPFNQPITGEETLDDLSRPEHALVQFYRAFNTRDLTLMSQNWLDSDEASMDNPLGGIKRGWEEIQPVYRALFEGRARVTVEFYDYTLHAESTFFYAVGRERGKLIAGDGQSLGLRIRTTRLFKKIRNGWRQVHHHGSIDESGLLEAYQNLVLPRR